ncbi:MAG: sensor histidine kinase [Phascolarctobacterium sp.]|nr:sensor histidine kinase [Phascolarctobacterium sp.]
MSENLRIRPYARLITMLGEQLIKDNIIALTEIIKNSYDADASQVKVDFVNFSDNYEAGKNAKIIIQDDGVGMDEDILRNHWLNPATPIKASLKKNNRGRTVKGRIIQGEKGIGRFAVFKLGKCVKVITRKQSVDKNGVLIDEGEKNEYVLDYDFSNYDENFMTAEDSQGLFLDELNVKFDVLNIDGGNRKYNFKHGTVIEISELEGEWSEKLVKKFHKEIQYLQPIFEHNAKPNFNIQIFRNGKIDSLIEKDYVDKLENCLYSKSVFQITNGFCDIEKQIVEYNINKKNERINFADFFTSAAKKFFEELSKEKRKLQCGSFRFVFYCFDLDGKSDTKYFLDKEQKQIIKQHRIYLYRDGIRVMPYGDPQDDWLQIDIKRGTSKAGGFFSNDQLVGCVYITQKDNERLRDKTNREGLIEEGNALNDFVQMIQIILAHIKVKYYDAYKIDKKRKEEQKIVNQNPLKLIGRFREEYKDDQTVKKILNDFETNYKKERSILDDRIAKTEDLAAVGLSVETASHDMMLVMQKVRKEIDDLMMNIRLRTFDGFDEVFSTVEHIQENLTFIANSLKDLQILFPSSKLHKHAVSVTDSVNRIASLYKRSYDEKNIKIEIENSEESFWVISTDAVLFQTFINLFDNALYWINFKDITDRRVKIVFDVKHKKVIFADSGRGIFEDAEPYIFEAFYSGKGEDGRGLGLYIARQLLDRFGFSINLLKEDKILSGANFVIDFSGEGDNHDGE